MAPETIGETTNAAHQAAGRVLAINPGTTSTKFGIFTRQGEQLTRNIHHGDDEIERFKGRPMLDRLEYRAELIEKSLADAGFTPKGKSTKCPKDEPWEAVAGRGGLLPPMECGTYLVDDAMVEALRLARRGEHASNLGAVLALRFAQAAGVSAYIVDPVTADEWQPSARLSGSPLIERAYVGHSLNTKAVAKRYARGLGRSYASLRLIVIHMGSGITVSAHREGRMIDSNSIGEGPFGPDRTGSLPVLALIKLCRSGTMSDAELDRHVFGDGGLFAYLGTRDLIEVERRIESGNGGANDAKAAAVFEAMIYQIGKEAGAMAAVLEGKVDAVLVTGGMAHSERAVNRLRSYVEWIAPVEIYPSEDELRALAEGVFRVLDGEEEAKRIKTGISD
ncbi:MAG: butyrate kinase [Terracidiphilus sp.]